MRCRWPTVQGRQRVGDNLAPTEAHFGGEAELQARLGSSTLVPESDDIQALSCDAIVDEVTDASEVQAAHINFSVVLYFRADPGVLSQDFERALEVQPYRARCSGPV